MRRAFTLIELLVVTLVIAILVGIVFRLAGVAADSSAMQETILHMQRLENCLSGYYAAFGSYPPVEIYGSRNPFYPVSKFGYVQQTRNAKPDYSSIDSYRAETACRSQPVAAEFPFSSKQGSAFAKDVSDTIQELLRDDGFRAKYGWCGAAKPFDGLQTPRQLNGKKKNDSWDDIQLFKFGLMSFLVPRYLAMMGHTDDSMYSEFLQWNNKNSRPCRFEDGVQYPTWTALNQDLRLNEDEKWLAELIPSQAVTLRWMPNLEKICHCNFVGDKTFYGIDISYENAKKQKQSSMNPNHPDTIRVYSSDDTQSGESPAGSQIYALDLITVKDGWLNELYYYSPPPYQSYRLWSAGPNGCTFPPWITDEQIRNDPDMKKFADTIRDWIADDVVHLSH